MGFYFIFPKMAPKNEISFQKVNKMNDKKYSHIIFIGHHKQKICNDKITIKPKYNSKITKHSNIYDTKCTIQFMRFLHGD
jgi:hypothetical protein